MFIAIDKNDRLIHVDHTVPDKTYRCPICERELVIRRGDKRRSFFAHKANEACTDSWNQEYDISEWHSEWQSMFPVVNQEVVVQIGDIKHRADVLTGKTVIEFQHSRLSADMFNKRNAFYQNLGYKVVWLFDLTEEKTKEKISWEEQGNQALFRWKNPRNTITQYDLAVGQTELFFQVGDKDDKRCIVKIDRCLENSFTSFVGNWFSKEDFLQYFQTGDGNYPEPYRDSVTKNENYIAFKNEYHVVLDAQQERAVEAVDGSVLVLAVPGSGKTTTLIARVGYMVKCLKIDPRSILVLTYTKSAALDMKNRYSTVYGSCSVKFMTINSFSYGILSKFDGPKEVIKQTESEAILTAIYKKHNPNEFPAKSDLQMALTMISNIKNMMLDEDDIGKMTIWASPATEVYQEYKQALEEKGKIDFDDQIRIAYDILKDNPKTLGFVQNWYKYVCVDEAQDTSKLQYELIKLVVGGRNNVFMVGDEDQSIYRFRGAFPQALLGFKEEYPNPYILQIETNYRSTGAIVEKAAEFIAKNSNRYKKRMIAVNEMGEEPQRILVADRDQQYMDVVDRIEKEKGTVAVLFRDNVCALPVVDLMLKKNISFKLRKPEEVSFFNEHVTRDIKNFMKLSLNDRDTDAFKEIYYKCLTYIRKKDVTGICGKVWYEKKNIYEAAEAFLSWSNRDEGHKARNLRNAIEPMKQKSPVEAIEHILGWGYRDYLRKRNLSENQVEILKALAKTDVSCADFLKHLETLEKQMKNMSETESRITLSTVHSSKGLEYDSVYLVDVFDGLFPSIMQDASETEAFESMQEERRLFYVAMTRAKKSLTVYQMQDRESSFVDEVFPTIGKCLKDIADEMGTEFIAQNLWDNNIYHIRFWQGWLQEIRYFDIDTGEIGEELEVHLFRFMTNKRIWRGVSSAE